MLRRAMLEMSGQCPTNVAAVKKKNLRGLFVPWRAGSFRGCKKCPSRHEASRRPPADVVVQQRPAQGAAGIGRQYSGSCVQCMAAPDSHRLFMFTMKAANKEGPCSAGVLSLCCRATPAVRCTAWFAHAREKQRHVVCSGSVTRAREDRMPGPGHGLATPHQRERLLGGHELLFARNANRQSVGYARSVLGMPGNRRRPGRTASVFV